MAEEMTEFPLSKQQNMP